MDEIKSLELSGWEHLNADRFDEALKVFNEVYKIDRKNVAAFQGLIACHRKKHDYKNALTILEEALGVFPLALGILCEKVWLYNDQNQYDKATDALNDVLKIKKDDATLFLWQLYFLRRQCKYSDSALLLKEARELFPSNTNIIIEEGWLAFYQSQFEKSIQIFDQVLENLPSNELAYQGKIACLRKQANYKEALKLCDKAINELQETESKESPGIYSERGWINLEREKYEAAEEDFRKVLSLISNDPYAHINLAWSLIKQKTPGNLKLAAKQCKNALDIHPDLCEAFGCLGYIAFKEGNIREAESYYIRSIKSDQVKGSYADLGALYIRMERYDEAKAQLNRALKNNPEDLYARLEMGYLYFYTDKIKDALREFRVVTMMDPNNPESFKALAIALIENKNLIEAEKVLRNAIKTMDKKKRYSLHLALSQVLTLLGDQTTDSSFYKDALEQVRAAFHIIPNDAPCHFNSGIIRFKLEDYNGSLSSFKKCLKQDEKCLEAELNQKKIKLILQGEKSLIKSSKFSSIFLTVIFLAQLFFVWYLYLKTNKITSAMISILVPILSGLLIVSIMLPWLSRFKLSGIEAELNNPRPKESMASGPKGGDIILSNNLKTLF